MSTSPYRYLIQGKKTLPFGSRQTSWKQGLYIQPVFECSLWYRQASSSLVGSWDLASSPSLHLDWPLTRLGMERQCRIWRTDSVRYRQHKRPWHADWGRSAVSRPLKSSGWTSSLRCLSFVLGLTLLSVTSHFVQPSATTNRPLHSTVEDSGSRIL